MKSFTQSDPGNAACDAYEMRRDAITLNNCGGKMTLRRLAAGHGTLEEKKRGSKY